MLVISLNDTSDSFHLSEGVVLNAISEEFNEIQGILSISEIFHEIQGSNTWLFIVILDFLGIASDFFSDPIDKISLFLVLFSCVV